MLCAVYRPGVTAAGVAAAAAGCLNVCAYTVNPCVIHVASPVLRHTCQHVCVSAWVGCLGCVFACFAAAVATALLMTAVSVLSVHALSPWLRIANELYPCRLVWRFSVPTLQPGARPRPLPDLSATVAGCIAMREGWFDWVGLVATRRAGRQAVMGYEPAPSIMHGLCLRLASSTVHDTHTVH